MDACPSVRQNLAIADIRGNDDGTGKETAHFRQPVEVFQRTRANDYTLRSVVERSLNQLPAPYSPSQLNFDVSCGEDGLHLCRVIAASSHCIQVDQVKMPESVLPPCNGDSNRIWNPNKLTVIRTSRELDAGPASEVERRNCDHWARRTIRAPIMRGETAALIAC
jgi:hypothetical protein